MGIFTFTVACGVAPTPTPTPSPTPVPYCCKTVQVYNNDYQGWDVYWYDCYNNFQSTYVGPYSYDVLYCAKQYSWYDFSGGYLNYTEVSDCSGVNNTCLATPTPTPTFTPTNTPVPTATPVPNRTVSIYAKRADTPTCIVKGPSGTGTGTEPQFRIYYSFGFPMPLVLVGGSVASNTCNFVGNISVPSGNTLYIGCRSWSYLSPIQYGVASGTSTCPDTGLDAYCGTLFDYGGSLVYSQVITADTSLAFTANVVTVYNKTSGCKQFAYCGGVSD